MREEIICFPRVIPSYSITSNMIKKGKFYKQKFVVLLIKSIQLELPLWVVEFTDELIYSSVFLSTENKDVLCNFKIKGTTAS